jgi:Hemerythrin HHE cation binding domain
MGMIESNIAREADWGRNERRRLLEHLAAFDRALDRLDWRSEARINLAAAHEIGYHCARLEDDLARHFPFREQIEPAVAAAFSLEMGDFTEQLRSDHDELRHWLAQFSRALEGFACESDPYEAVCRIREEGQKLVRQMARHLALEEGELGSFL